MSSDSRRPDPGDFPPREAVERYINQRRPESTDHTIQTYYYRLKLFVEFCEGSGIDSVSELTGWDFDAYENARRGEDVSPVTLNGEMQTLKNFVEYLERIEAVEDGLADKVHVPTVDEDQETSEKRLEAEAALKLLRHYRETPSQYGAVLHAYLEVLWYTGARMGGVRALDVQDYHSDEAYLDFTHRPDTDTPLKNGRDGERPVSLPREVCDVLDRYVEHDRYDVHDEHGRQPLFTTSRGRPSSNSLRNWAYLATFPCRHSDCPHGKDPETCEYKQFNNASKCPSSRSPHQIRTGAITWFRDLGLPAEVVSERVNSSLDIIERHYDQASALERMEKRRRPFVDRLSLENDHDSDQ